MILTIGHSDRTIADLLGCLVAHRVHEVVDVRRYPRSRRHPQFDPEALHHALAPAGIAYRHVAELGGMRESREPSPNAGWKDPRFRGFADYMGTAAFDHALVELIATGRDRRVVALCAERDPSHCHRSLIADALVTRGIAVSHILDRDRADGHVLNPWARIEGQKLVYPGAQGRLELDGR